nr:unnamed protein product [Digitaria exilis]
MEEQERIAVALGSSQRRALREKSTTSDISCILSLHPGPGRRLSVVGGNSSAAAALDGWLRSPALDGLQELKFHLEENLLRHCRLASAHHFASTLVVASFGCCVFLSSLEKLTLSNAPLE